MFKWDTYEGVFNGRKWQSCYPNIYKVSYSYLHPATNQIMFVEKFVSHYHESLARQREEDSNVVGKMTVEHVFTLTKVEDK